MAYTSQRNIHCRRWDSGRTSGTIGGSGRGSGAWSSLSLLVRGLGSPSSVHLPGSIASLAISSPTTTTSMATKCMYWLSDVHRALMMVDKNVHLACFRVKDEYEYDAADDDGVIMDGSSVNYTSGRSVGVLKVIPHQVYAGLDESLDAAVESSGAMGRS